MSSLTRLFSPVGQISFFLWFAVLYLAYTSLWLDDGETVGFGEVVGLFGLTLIWMKVK